MSPPAALATVPDQLRTPRLVLRPYRDDDVDELLVIESDPEVVRYLYWEPRSREEVATALAGRIGATSLATDGDALHLAVDHEGCLVGELVLWIRSIEHQQAEVGFVFSPLHHGQGLATEATAALLEWAFASGRIHRVFGRADARNTASVALMRRLGMREEAMMRENEWCKGEWSDEVVCAVLVADWQAAHGG